MPEMGQVERLAVTPIVSHDDFLIGAACSKILIPTAVLYTMLLLEIRL